MSIEKIREQLSQKNFNEALSLATSYSKIISSTQNSDDVLGLAKVLEEFPNDFDYKTKLVRKKIAVLTGYTGHFISQSLRAVALQYGIWLEVYETGYGLFRQAAIGEDAKLSAFHPDLCYLYVGNEHLSGKSAEEDVADLKVVWKQLHDRFTCDIIQNNFDMPTLRTAGNLDAKTDSPYRRHMQLNLLLAEQSPAYVHINNVDYLSSVFGITSFRDEKMYDYSKIPTRFEMLIPYTANICAVIAAILGKSKKCIVLDLDNTLWGGVVGDDGVAGIEIGEGSATGEAFKRFQVALKAQKDRGVLLAVCSKNEEANAKEPFVKRDEMVLRLDDISCFVANWDPKSHNIQRIAQMLNIGLDSLLFIDDNPAEREIVRQQLPEVAILDLPEDSSDYCKALSSCNWLDAVNITKEDLRRTELYKENAERQQLSTTIGDYESYLKSLEMVATIGAFDDLNLPRITQLINKTNQFNLTTKRYTETEIETIAKDPNAITFYVKVADKFGDNGLISVFIGIKQQDRLIIDTWLMSCRVLKRRVEDLLFLHVMKSSMANKLSKIEGERIPTEKNILVENLLSKAGFISISTEDRKMIFDLTDEKKVQEWLSKKLPFTVHEKSI